LTPADDKDAVQGNVKNNAQIDFPAEAESNSATTSWAPPSAPINSI
jgi:hypothetical protein